MWTYAYQIVPPQSRLRLRPIMELLVREHLDARRGGRIWAARVLCDRQLTHILIVSDSLDQDEEINQRLELEVKRLMAHFFITMPLAFPSNVAIRSGVGLEQPPARPPLKGPTKSRK